MDTKPIQSGSINPQDVCEYIPLDGEGATDELTPDAYTKDYLRKYNEICSPVVTNIHVGEISPSYPSLQVHQHEYAVATYNEEAGSLVTGGVFPCIVLAIYDPVTKTGALAHFDKASLVPQSLDAIFNEFDKNDIPRERLQANVMGGMPDPSSCACAGNITDRLKENGIAEPKVMVRGFREDTHIFALDLKDGSVGSMKKMPVNLVERARPEMGTTNTHTSLDGVRP